MRALENWRKDHICPLCGFPKEVCQAPETEFELGEPARVRCHVTTRLRAAQKTYADDPTGRPDGLLWMPTFRSAGGNVTES